MSVYLYTYIQWKDIASPAGLAKGFLCLSDVKGLVYDEHTAADTSNSNSNSNSKGSGLLITLTLKPSAVRALKSTGGRSKIVLQVCPSLGPTLKP